MINELNNLLQNVHCNNVIHTKQYKSDQQLTIVFF